MCQGFLSRAGWSNAHYLTADELHERYPRAAGFIAVRRELDPDGKFLNDHLRPPFP